MLAFLFWFMLILLFYSYAGYGLVLYLLVTLKRKFGKEEKPPARGV